MSKQINFISYDDRSIGTAATTTASVDFATINTVTNNLIVRESYQPTSQMHILGRSDLFSY